MLRNHCTGGWGVGGGGGKRPVEILPLLGFFRLCNMTVKVCFLWGQCPKFSIGKIIIWGNTVFRGTEIICHNYIVYVYTQHKTIYKMSMSAQKNPCDFEVFDL